MLTSTPRSIRLLVYRKTVYPYRVGDSLGSASAICGRFLWATRYEWGGKRHELRFAACQGSAGFGVCDAQKLPRSNAANLTSASGSDLSVTLWCWRAWVPIAQQWRMYPAAADGHRLCFGRVTGPAVFLLVWVAFSQCSACSISLKFCWTTLRQHLAPRKREPPEDYAAYDPVGLLSQHRHHGPH